MALLGYPTPSLIGGVSQQPDALRFSNQARVCDNAWMSPVDGLVKRWATDHVTKVIDGGFATPPTIHTINRDKTERYVSIISNKKVRVYDLDGTEYGVYAAGGGAPDFSYLDNSAEIGNLITGGAVFAADWTASDMAAVASTTDDPWKAETAVKIQRSATSTVPKFEQTVGNFEADGTSQVFYVYLNVDDTAGDVASTVNVAIRDNAGSWVATSSFDTATKTVSVGDTSLGTVATGGVDPVTNNPNWYRVWVAVESGVDGGKPVPGNARTAEITLGGASSVGYGVLAYGPTLLAGESKPKNLVPDGDFFRALTVADYTFVLNRNKTVAMDTTPSSKRSQITNSQYGEGLVFVQSALNCCQYSLRLEGWGGTYDVGTWTRGVQADTADPPNNDKCGNTVVNTSAIAAQLISDIGSTATNLQVTSRTHGGTDSGHNTAPVFHVSGTGWENLTSIEAWTDKGDRMSAIMESVATITDLPLVGSNGFKVKVYGDSESKTDDYYLEFQGVDPDVTGLQSGVWVEAVAPKIKYQFDASTLPHQLTRRQDNSSGAITGTPYAIYFEWAPVAWDNRQAGDELTNPDPTFVGRKLEDIFFHANRLGFLSGQNVILSEVGNYFNFWRTSITEGLVDSDRIDVSASMTDVVIMRHAKPFENVLLLFSDRAQFQMSGDPALTPKTAEIIPVFHYETYTSAPPVTVGRGTLLPFKKASFSGLREIIRSGEESFADIDTTAQVPAYISGEIMRIAGSSIENVAIALADGDQSKLYVYKWVWSGNDKVQSAWSRWDMGLDAEILDISFIESDLYMVVQRSEGIFLEKMEVSSLVTDPGLSYQVRIDRRVSDADCTTTYDAASDMTTVVLPYDISKGTITAEADKVPMIASDAATGVPITIEEIVNATTVKLSGNHDLDLSGTDFYFGFGYEFVYEFGQVSLLDNREGSSTTSRKGRISLRRCAVEVEDTAFFEAHVTPKGRATTVIPFTPPMDEDALIGSVALYDGEFGFPVIARADRVSVQLRSDSALPCRFMTAEWDLTFSSQSTRTTG